MSLDKTTRQTILAEHTKQRDELVRLARAQAPYAQLAAVRQAIAAEEKKYFDQLPRMTLSRCPFTAMPLEKAFDPWGPDGLWWQEKELRETAEPAAPPTFQLLRGAVHLNGLPPAGGREAANLGPEVPYVIPRILDEFPSMIAVVSRMELECGYTAYPIVYYSTFPPTPGRLAQTWREETYNWKDASGRGGWSVPTDPWDFDLEPWVERGRVLWINPGDVDFTVQRGAWKDFPYANLPGRREQVFVQGTESWTRPAPNNEDIDPFE